MLPALLLSWAEYVYRFTPRQSIDRNLEYLAITLNGDEDVKAGFGDLHVPSAPFKIRGYITYVPSCPKKDLGGSPASGGGRIDDKGVEATGTPPKPGGEAWTNGSNRLALGSDGARRRRQLGAWLGVGRIVSLCIRQCLDSTSSSY